MRPNQSQLRISSSPQRSVQSERLATTAALRQRSADQALSGADQAASAIDQAASDADRQSSANGRDASRREQSRADLEQRASDADQMAADQDVRHGPPQTAIERAASRHSRALRAGATTDRLAAANERAHADCDRTAANASRGRISAARDASSAERDEIASDRDAVARAVSPTHGPSGDPRSHHHARVRESAAQNRAQLAEVRRVAASARARQLVLEANLAIDQERQADHEAAEELATTRLASSRLTAISMELPLAVARQELSLRYQPVYDLTAQKVVGFEALVRWSSATLGTVQPDEFIPVAEATGEIMAIGDWVLESALSTLATWRHERPERELTVAVNVAPQEFLTQGYAARVHHLLQAAGVPASALTLEVTERTLVDDAPALRCVMETLRATGVRLSVDDFGTGFSSLSRLCSFPLDELKIDRIFVAGLVDDQRQRALVAGIVGMSKALDLRVVAEGIETREQNHIVRELGCDLGQGFLMSRPLAPAALEDVLSA